MKSLVKAPVTIFTVWLNQ